MIPRNPVLWTEGMFLRPQHFQQQRRYYEGLLEARCGRSVSYLWGILDLKMDESVLGLGKVGVAHARGVFSDGTPFDLPASDPVPAYFEPDASDRERLAGRLIYIGLPLRKPGVPLVSSTGNGALARLRRHELDLGDETRDGSETEIVHIGHLSTSILVEGQDLSDYTYLTIGRIKEIKGDGQVVLDEDFVPPSLDVKASKVLLDHLTALQGLVQHYADSLAKSVIAPGRGGIGEESEFFKLQILNRYEPLIDHLAKLDILHPELLFRTMLTLLGDLVTFTERTKRGRDYPGYRHELPEQPFLEVMNRLRDAMGKAVERKAMQLEIVERGYGISTVAIPDSKLVTNGRFVLAAKGPITPERLGTLLPALVKVAPVDNIAYLVRRNLTGIPVALVPNRPEEVPYHEGFIYFGLDRFHELWKEIEKTSQFAFHVTRNEKTPSLEFEMWVIKEDK